MTPEQYKGFQDLAEKLAGVALVDADPDNWIGSKKIPGDLSKDERGDAYWCRKQASATLAVLWRISSLVELIQDQTNRANKGGVAEVKDPEDELKKQVASAEKEARKMIRKAAEKNGAKG